MGMIRTELPREASAAPRNFVTHLRRLADKQGDRQALLFLGDAEHGEVACSYALLDRHARAVAARLAAEAKPGERALLMLDTSLGYASAFFGCLYSGVIAVPAFPPEPRRPQHQARLLGIVKDARPALVLVHAAQREAVADMLAAEHGHVRIVSVEEIDLEQA